MTNSKDEAPDTIRLVRRGNFLDMHWYYPDEAIRSFDDEFVYIRAGSAVPSDASEVRFALEGMIAAFDRDDYSDPSIVATTRECALSVAKQAVGWDGTTSSVPPPAPRINIHQRMDEHEHVSLVKGIFGGVTPLVSKIRISVHDILTYLYNGNSIEYIAENYNLTPEAIKDAIAFAQDVYDDVVETVLRDPVATPPPTSAARNAAREIRQLFKERFVIPSEDELATIITRHFAGVPGAQSSLSKLQQAVVEHDNDIARLDRNTLPAEPIRPESPSLHWMTETAKEMREWKGIDDSQPESEQEKQ